MLFVRMPEKLIRSRLGSGFSSASRGGSHSKLKKILRLIAVLAMVGLVGGHHRASAAVAQVISYQGRLTDGSNNPITNPALSVTFKIYPAPTGPGALWTEGQTVAVSDGLFHVLLGSGTALPAGLFGTAPRYLGIQVGADPEMTPRQQIASAPSALQVGSVDGASGVP